MSCYIRAMKKFAFAVLALALATPAFAWKPHWFKHKNEPPQGVHAKAEHPKGYHPEAYHPTAEHPKDEHDKAIHPKAVHPENPDLKHPEKHGK